MRLTLCRFPLLLAASYLRAQTAASDDVIRIGPGVTPPRVLHKIEPEYSPDARADHVQGTVVFQLVVNEKGRPTNITVISPLGFGLDERAKAAIEKWEFAPAMKNGAPVKILATIEVNFRFPQIWFDRKAEQERTTFNLALRSLKGGEPKIVDHAVKLMQELAHEHFPPAMFMVGVWESTGEHVTRDSADGLSLIQKAAAKNYGPALYEIAIRQIEGRDLPMDLEKGLDVMRKSAMLGSPKAQFYLGVRYAADGVVPMEPDRSRRYFRLCAAQGLGLCQYKLGQALLDTPDRQERDYVQAIAWFQLAAESGVAEAQAISNQETAKLTPAQVAWVKTLKEQMLRK